MAKNNNSLKVVLFSGGRGTTSIADALLRYPEIELTILVNAYDDGLSTGMLRRFIPGMLGPSDIRKVISRLVSQRTDQMSRSLQFLLEYRFPKDTDVDTALRRLKSFIDWDTPDTDDELIAARNQLAVGQLQQASRFIEAFLRYYQKTKRRAPWFTFADTSLGNILFAGCYLLNNHDFNLAIDGIGLLAGTAGRVLNVTHGENRVLVGIKEDGRLIENEASIVGPQDSARIEDIFLLKDYLSPTDPRLVTDKKTAIEFLRHQEQLPKINPQAAKVLRNADVIIYGPGTQHSSLFPSYLTKGVAEAIQSNAGAEKIFIANIIRDYDILADSAATLVRAFLWNMSRKQAVTLRYNKLITRFFFQKPESNSAEDEYLPFEAEKFPYPLDKVTWIDLEGDKGKHLGSRTVTELLYIIEAQLQKRVHHVTHKVSIVVPALNEQRTIKTVLRDLRALTLPYQDIEKEIIVVDGGSTDKTVAIAKQEPGVRVYQVTGKRGRGAALRLGIEKAKGELIVFFPSDAEYHAGDISRIIAPIINQEFPVVFGSRAFRSSDLNGNLQHIYGGKGLSYLMSKYGGMLLSVMLLLGHQRYISDTFTSIKGFDSRIFRKLKFVSHGVEFDMELIVKIAKARHPILEIPVNYRARTVKEGKKITAWDGIKSIFALIRFSG